VLDLISQVRKFYLVYFISVKIFFSVGGKLKLLRKYLLRKEKLKIPQFLQIYRGHFAGIP
jgi:hypothetical protein